MKMKSFWSGLLCSSLALTSYAGVDSLEVQEKLDLAQFKSGSGVRMGMLLPASDTSQGLSLNKGFNYLGLGTPQGKGLLENDLKVTGVVRALTIYRSMEEGYVDMINSDKNMSFTDYPLSNIGTNTNGGFPMIELGLQSQLTSNFDFNIGYSLAPNFTGNLNPDGNSRVASARQNLNFRGSLKTGMIKTTVWAGEILWTNLSRFTMGQPEYRDNYFERLPWDWYRESFQRYREYFSLSSNIGGEQLGRSPLTGFIGEVEWLPAQISFKGIYGRTNRTVTLANSNASFPGYTMGYRLEKLIFERKVRGKIGLNLYGKRADTDFVGEKKDNNTITSLDFNVKVKKVNLSGEIGYGMIDNDSTAAGTGQYGNGRGLGVVFKTEFDRRAVLWPFSVEFFNIDKNLVSLDGGVINSNGITPDGGISTENIYNSLYFPNMSAEVGQIANNRRGVNLKLEANLGSFRAQVGYAASTEIEKLNDTVSIQHRVNAFSRSRFRPWFQAAGPYHRIKSFWLRTFETITVTNRNSDGSAKGHLDRQNFGFNTLELFLKYKTKIGKHEIVLLNFSSLNTVKYGFNAFGTGDNLISVAYNDFTAAFQLNKQISLIGNVAFEAVNGSINTDLSPDKPTAANEDRVIDQFGRAFAAGIDFDLNRTTSLHLRTKYMDHEDKNFTKDKFSGFETTFELKIFFN